MIVGKICDRWGTKGLAVDSLSGDGYTLDLSEVHVALGMATARDPIESLSPDRSRNGVKRGLFPDTHIVGMLYTRLVNRMNSYGNNSVGFPVVITS